MNTFRPDCTVPTETPVFVSATNIRSTLDIVWSCLSVLILSSWSILHLNVPQQFEPRTTLQKWRLKAHHLLRKVKWMLVALIAPEIIFAKAVGEALSAHQKTPHLQSFAHEDEVPWTTAHTRFADMGGFAIRFSDLAPASTSEDENEEEREAGWIRDNLAKFQARMHELESRYGPTAWKRLPAHEKPCLDCFGQNISTSRKGHFTYMGDIWVLNAAELCQARKMGLVARLPRLTDMDLADKNKGDVFVKVLALLQFTWLAMQLCARWALGKPSSPLEIMTFAFAICAFLIYLILLQSPQDVITPVYVPASRLASASDMQDMALFAPPPATGSLVFESSLRRVGRVANDVILPRWPHHDHVAVRNQHYGFLVVSSLLFGGLHLLAWNSPFPTETEKILWRVASLVTMLHPLSIIIGGLSILHVPIDSDLTYVASVTYAVVMMAALVLARVFLVVEAFRSLYYLPPASYENTWAANVPHFG